MNWFREFLGLPFDRCFTRVCDCAGVKSLQQTDPDAALISIGPVANQNVRLNPKVMHCQGRTESEGGVTAGTLLVRVETG